MESPALRYDFKDLDPSFSGIENVATGNHPATLKVVGLGNRSINVTSTSTGNSVCIYGIDGTGIAVATAGSTINLPATGLYIVTDGNTSCKIRVR